MRWLDGHRLDGLEFEQAPGVGEGQEQAPGMLQSMSLQSQTQLSYWTELKRRREARSWGTDRVKEAL